MALLSDHRRDLFAVNVNNLITAEYNLDAQLNIANPDSLFELTRQECDLKDPRPYQDLLCGKTIRRNRMVEANIVQTLHNDSILNDFLKYLDQLFVDKKNESDSDKKNKLGKRVKIAFNLLDELMHQVCILGIDEIFNNKSQLIKETFKGQRGQRISNYFEKVKQKLSNEFDKDFLNELTSGPEIQFDNDLPLSSKDRAQNLGFRLFREDD